MKNLSLFLCLFLLQAGLTAQVECESNGGMLISEDYTFCVDGSSDFVSEVLVEGTLGESQQWVVTDQVGTILGLPGSPSDVDFDEAGGGICLIWNLAYSGEIDGLLPGNNALTDLEGCYDLSDNFVTITRNAVHGGTLSTSDATTICAGDNIADPVTVQVSGAEGPASVFVITSAFGQILGLQEGNVFDFKGAGEGVCRIWYLSYAPGLTGLVSGNSIFTDLEGCYDLSKAINVVRQVGENCDQPEVCVAYDFQETPTGLTSSIGPEGVTLTWDSYPGATLCRVSANRLSAAKDRNFLVFGNTENPPSSFTLSEDLLFPATDYRWRVRCGCSATPLIQSPFSEYAFFNTLEGGFIEEQGESKNSLALIEQSLSIFPVPASYEITLSAEGLIDEALTMTFSDLSGRIVQSNFIRVQNGLLLERVDISQMDSGLYMLSLHGERESISRLIQVSR